LSLFVLRRHSERSEESLYVAFAVAVARSLSAKPSLLDNLGSQHYLPS
jgi:hypothetical protein